MSEVSVGVGRKRKDAPYPSPYQGSDRNGEAAGNEQSLPSHTTFLHPFKHQRRGSWSPVEE